MTIRKNRNRGYQQLRVWDDAVAYYVMTWNVVKNSPYELRRIESQAIASSDSVHRNIAEGYCRRTLSDYIKHLYYSLGSLGESTSGMITYRKAGHITDEDFENLDALSYKLENGLLKLVESLEEKKDDDDWSDSLLVKESNELYSTGD